MYHVMSYRLTVCGLKSYKVSVNAGLPLQDFKVKPPKV